MKSLSKISGLTRSETGFTIVELLVAMAISLVVMAAVYTTYNSQQKAYIAQDQVSAAQQNLRAAMYVMTKDMRMAGFDTDTTSGDSFGITKAAASEVAFTSDNGSEPDTNYGDNTLESDEAISYSLNDTDDTLIRTVGTTSQVIAQNIVKIGFGYSYDSDGDGLAEMSGGDTIWAVDSNDDNSLDVDIDGTALSSTVSIDNIKSVRIWLLARTEKTIRDYNDNKTYTVGNSEVTPEAGYMYRLLSETVRCRNL